MDATTSDRKARQLMFGVSSTAAAIPLALGAAASFAVANVAQMRAARRVRAPAGVHPKLLLRLFGDPAWLGGLAASVVGYLLQATALFIAPVLLVQPLIVTELLFALPLAAALAGVRLHRREWAGVGLVAAGITAFVAGGHPSGEGTHVANTTWVAIIASTAVVVAVLVVVAESLHHQPMARASALAAASSVCFGLLSMLTKVVGHQFQHDGIGALLLAQPWLLALAALTGLLLQQTAFRIAPLSVSLPVIDVGEPLVASLFAAFAFGETIGLGVGTAIGVAVSAGAAALGMLLLDTSPVVRAAQADIRETTEPDGTAPLGAPVGQQQGSPS
ncbi:MAG TPA: DMT family transporter [Mycobacteriales bacterium]|nr:DMT family transporter [Mycobacteriales bacterium]